MYESTDLVKKLYKDKHGKVANDRKVAAIVSHFAQGHEYFQSARDAGELVRPLILYYGALALSRGLILFLTGTPAAEIKAAHGLIPKGWTILNDHPEKLPDATVKIQNNGTFPELCGATANSEVCQMDTKSMPKAVVRSRYAGSHPIPPGSEIAFREILAQIPDVQDLHEQTFDACSDCLPCEVKVDPSFGEDGPARGNVTITLYQARRGVPDPGCVGEALGLHYVKRSEVEQYSYMAQTKEVRAKPGFFFSQTYQEDPTTGEAQGLHVVRSRGTGHYFLHLPAKSGLTASSLIALYLLAYATSSLVRYHPAYWLTLLGKGEGDSMAPIITAAISAVEEQFPELILEYLR